MPEAMRASLLELVKTFKDETEARFGFLVQDYGFSNESGLSDSSSPISLLKKWENGQTPSHFWIVQRFSKANMHFEIAYGDKELVIEGHWLFEDSEPTYGVWKIFNATRTSEHKFGLWEILDAAIL